VSTEVAKGRDRAELGVAALLLVVGIVVLVDAVSLETNIAQRGPIGPKAIPLLVGALLLLVSGLLARDVWRGGRGEPEGGEDVDLTHGTDWKTVGLLAAAFVANLLLIERLGWPVSGAVLFAGAAAAMGSRHYIRDIVIAVAMSVGTWYLFVLGLGIDLPVGILKGIL
jgi:putative tricarboxylic transport membrane protein